MNWNIRLAALTIAVSSISPAFSQDRPIGYWRAHMPYNKAMSVAYDGTTIYAATEKSFYTNNTVTNELTPYSKVEGMSDVGMSYLGYDNKTKTAVLAYANSNIDLFKDGSFFNIPDLKLKSVTGSKNINHIFTENGLAYLSTDVGIIVISLENREIKESYTFSMNNQLIPVTGVTTTDNEIYAATPKGLYSIGKQSIAIQDFSSWNKLDTSRNFISIASSQNKVFVTEADSLFAVENGGLKFVYRTDTFTRHIDPAKDGIWISENFKSFNGQVKRMDLNYQLADSFTTDGYSKQVVEIEGGATYIADEFNGLKRRNLTNNSYFNTDIPEGPTTYTSFDVYARNKELWVAHGGYDERWIFTFNRSGFSQFKDEKWKPYKMFDYPPFGDSTFDFVKILKGPDGNVYAGSNQSGLFVLKGDGSYEIFKQGYFDESFGAGGTYRVSGLAFDTKGNLWMNAFGGAHELVVKTKDGNWYQYSVPYSRPYPNAAAHLIIDDNGQKWWASPRGGGVIVYDDNGTPDNIVDDQHIQLVSGKGSGGLPDNEVFVLAKDQNNAIWIGTANGIGIVNCPGSVISRQCESELRVVQFDEFAGYLFQNEQVRAIAVDGGNRKWIGTNNGVWLLSPEGESILMRFTAENSPLPSNSIQTISIDPITGDVYISTEEGLVSFRGTATEGGAENANVVTFPNPVPSGYNGTIAITGVVENADVRITDISGQLIFKTKANGGQATWDGKDYTGRRPQSGVYLIFVTNRDGSQTHVGKMVFME